MREAIGRCAPAHRHQHARGGEPAEGGEQARPGSATSGKQGVEGKLPADYRCAAEHAARILRQVRQAPLDCSADAVGHRYRRAARLRCSSPCRRNTPGRGRAHSGGFPGRRRDCRRWLKHRLGKRARRLAAGGGGDLRAHFLCVQAAQLQAFDRRITL